MLVGAAWAGRSAVSIPRSLLALVVAVALQIGVNYANDYFDGVRGVDTAARIGTAAPGRVGPRATARGRDGGDRDGVHRRRGRARPRPAHHPLAHRRRRARRCSPWSLYSGGPRPYAASGLGEISVFVFFGLVATGGTAFVQQDRLDASVLWLAVPVGLLACALLMVNNLRDIPTDSAVGKRTLAVRLGAPRSRNLLVAIVVIALLLPIGRGAGRARLPWLVALTLLTIPLAVAPLRTVRTAEGRALVPALIGITRLQLVFGVVLAGALLAS